ncbi:MAG: hypothetical protein QXI11_09385 [Thermoproteota archaeon]
MLCVFRIEADLDRLFIDSNEVNIYGVVGGLCLIGEATVRLGAGLIEELKEKRPGLPKQKLTKVIYADCLH